eukprot:7597743-Alexandrium_andersonii.AAC.1
MNNCPITNPTRFLRNVWGGRPQNAILNAHEGTTRMDWTCSEQILCVQGSKEAKNRPCVASHLGT